MDLQHIKNLISYQIIDLQISKFKKMCGYLWYFTPEVTSLAFFDDSVPFQTNIKMVIALLKSRDIESENNKQIILPSNEILNFTSKDIDDFVSTQFRNYFDRFGILLDCLDLDPILWNENDQYKKGKQLVKNVHVINDIVEREVKLIEDYNKLVTKNKDLKQYFL